MSSDKPSKHTEKMDISRYDFVKGQASDRSIIYNQLVEMMGKEKAQSIYKEAFYKRWDGWVEDMLKDRKIQSFNDYKDFFKEVQVLMGELWLEQSIAEDSDEKLTFNISRCLIADAYKELGLEEIGYLTSCYPDYAIAEKVHACGKLVREHTLMKGGPYCDLTYVWEEE
jgi:hypothetical protein